MTMLQDELRHYIPVSGSPSQFFISIYSFYLNARVVCKDYRMHVSPPAIGHKNKMEEDKTLEE